MLCCVPTKCHKEALQCCAKPTPVVPLRIFHAPWLPWCSSKWPTMHLHISRMQLHGGMQGPTLGVFANHHNSITPPNASPHATIMCMPCTCPYHHGLVRHNVRCTILCDSTQALHSTSPSSLTTTHTPCFQPYVATCVLSTREHCRPRGCVMQVLMWFGHHIARRLHGTYATITTCPLRPKHVHFVAFSVSCFCAYAFDVSPIL